MTQPWNPSPVAEYSEPAAVAGEASATIMASISMTLHQDQNFFRY
ncbi:hypothetical protein GALL_380370 [mine drainage metagenome]|uniref:Uncharacterized protein n=1 Tax=mine drainage metagenome TaxID=410659 RepID=A0A1J5QRU7_9ZZZZ